MDLRGLLQLISCGVVLLVLFYQFELESPILITWKEAPTNQGISGAVLPQLNPVQVVTTSSKYKYVNEQPVYEEPQYEQSTESTYQEQAFIPPIQKIEEPILIIEEPVLMIEENKAEETQEQLIQNSTYDITVILPESMEQCNPFIISFKADGVYTTEERIAIREKFLVEFDCTDPRHDDEDHVTHKYVPVFHQEDGWAAKMYPDESTEECEVNVTGLDNVRLKGVNQKFYTVGPITERFCWECEPQFHRDLPLAQFFSIAMDNGEVLTDTSQIEITTGDTLTLWVVPHPLAIEMYPTIVDKCLFNAWLENPHVKQGVYTSHNFDQEHGGYKIEVTGRDAVVFKLKIVLNWIYPLSEVGTDEPEPILTSSHIRHSISSCDHTRSEIMGSNEISIAVSGPKEFIFPEVPVQCSNPNKEGRWLNVISIDSECRPPYCSGDRFETLISIMSWQGTIYPWLWVPYDCHYHYYSRSNITHCSQQKGIEWIHVMGDSLSREFVAHFKTLFNIMGVAKFENADILLESQSEAPDVRMTFRSFADLLARSKDAPPGRDPDFLESVLQHYNLLEAGSSKGMNFPSLKVEHEPEETSPDVIIMNSANAYSLFMETEVTYKQWLDDFSDLAGDAFIDGRRGDNKKTDIYWYANPYFHGTAHEGTEHITEARNRNFNRIAKPIVENMGLRYFDAAPISHMRWEESWDGLHYLNGHEKWAGHVSSTFIQVLLNQIFEGCDISQ